MRGETTRFGVWLAALLFLPGGAFASAAENEHERIVQEWAAALLTRDPAVVEATPWGYPQVDAAARLDLARDVLDRVVAADPEAAAAFQDPALSATEREDRLQDATRLLADLIFDRAALVARLQAEATTADPPALPSQSPLADGLLEAARREVEQLATIPASLEAIVLDAAADTGVPLAPPGEVEASPLAALQPLLPAELSFAVCWISAGDQGCAEVVPLAPLPLDVTADGVPDVLASLTLAPEPAALLSIPGQGPPTPQLVFRVERLPAAQGLAALVVGVFSVEGRILLAGFDAYTTDGREAPQALTIAAGATASAGDVRAAVAFQTAGAPASLRTLAGLATSSAWDPEHLLSLDTSPVPATLDLALHAWEDESGAHFEGQLELDRPIDLAASLRERARGGAEIHAATLDAAGVGPALALSVHRGEDAEHWSWETTTPVGQIDFGEESWRFVDASLAAPVSWRRQAIELEDVPARVAVDLPGHGAVSFQASGILGAVRFVRQAYDYASGQESYQAVGAEDIPVEVDLHASEVGGTFSSEGNLGRLSYQTASLDRSPAPGDVGRLLFDLSATTTHFLGVRGESATGGRALAVQVLDVPESVDFTLLEQDRGVDLDLVMSRGLGRVEGLVQIDDRRGILALSNLPKDIRLAASFDSATAIVGYDASAGIQEATVLYTDLALAPNPQTVHAYVQLLQLPRAVSLAITRAGDAPRLDYTAATSTTDVRALVHEDLFGGDLRARLLVSIDDLGASTSLGLATSAGEQILRLVSEPGTKRFLVEGFVQKAHTGSTSGHLRERCCWDAFGYDVRYGYSMAATLTVENLRIQLTDARALDLSLRAPDVAVSGTFGEFLVAWDAIHILGASSAWLRVDLVVFWIGINVWDWGWSSGTLHDLDLRITRYADAWGTLASVTVSPCSLAIEARPKPVETMLNGFRITNLQGGRQLLFLNPIGANGQTAVPGMLADAYMAWRHGGWRVDFGC